MEDAKKKKLYKYIWLFFQIPSALFIMYMSKNVTRGAKKTVPHTIEFQTGTYTCYSLDKGEAVAEITIESIDSDHYLISLIGNEFYYNNGYSAPLRYGAQEDKLLEFTESEKNGAPFFICEREGFVYVLIDIIPEKYPWIPDKSLHYLKNIFYIIKLSKSSYVACISNNLDIYTNSLGSCDFADYACYFYQDKHK